MVRVSCTCNYPNLKYHTQCQASDWLILATIVTLAASVGTLALSTEAKLMLGLNEYYNYVLQEIFIIC